LIALSIAREGIKVKQDEKRGEGREGKEERRKKKGSMCLASAAGNESANACKKMKHLSK